VEIYLTKYNIPYTPKVRFGERAVSWATH
jgi:hypothetical protein